MNVFCGIAFQESTLSPSAGLNLWGLDSLPDDFGPANQPLFPAADSSTRSDREPVGLLIGDLQSPPYRVALAAWQSCPLHPLFALSMWSTRRVGFAFRDRLLAAHRDRRVTYSLAFDHLESRRAGALLDNKRGGGDSGGWSLALSLRKRAPTGAALFQYAKGTPRSRGRGRLVFDVLYKTLRAGVRKSAFEMSPLPSLSTRVKLTMNGAAADLANKSPDGKDYSRSPRTAQDSEQQKDDRTSWCSPGRARRRRLLAARLWR